MCWASSPSFNLLFPCFSDTPGTVGRRRSSRQDGAEWEQKGRKSFKQALSRAEGGEGLKDEEESSRTKKDVRWLVGKRNVRRQKLDFSRNRRETKKQGEKERKINLELKSFFGQFKWGFFTCCANFNTRIEEKRVSNTRTVHFSSQRSLLWRCRQEGRSVLQIIVFKLVLVFPLPIHAGRQRPAANVHMLLQNFTAVRNCDMEVSGTTVYFWKWKNYRGCCWAARAESAKICKDNGRKRLTFWWEERERKKEKCVFKVSWIPFNFTTVY